MYLPQTDNGPRRGRCSPAPRGRALSDLARRSRATSRDLSRSRAISRDLARPHLRDTEDCERENGERRARRPRDTELLESSVVGRRREHLLNGRGALASADELLACYCSHPALGECLLTRYCSHLCVCFLPARPPRIEYGDEAANEHRTEVAVRSDLRVRHEQRNLTRGEREADLDGVVTADLHAKGARWGARRGGMDGVAAAAGVVGGAAAGRP